jgi:hypothetical protein
LSCSPPGGLVERGEVRIDERGEGKVHWISLPGEPLGDYTVIVQQGDRVATYVFEVHAPSEPHLIVRPPGGSSGTRFQIALVGYSPNQRVLLHLYHEKRYIMSLDLTIGSEGMAMVRWKRCPMTHPARIICVRAPNSRANAPSPTSSSCRLDVQHHILARGRVPLC